MLETPSLSINMERMGVCSLSNEEIAQYGKMVSILSNRMISDREAARDAAQEVWVEVMKSLPSFRGDSKLSTWIYSIAKRVIAKHAENERLYSLQFLHDYLHGDDREQPEAETGNDFWIKEECNRCLTGLFHCLNNDARMIYVFREIVGLPYDELAGIMDRDERDIRQILSRSRKKLRNFLNCECRIFNPASKCKCRMNRLLESIKLPEEYQRLRSLGKRISIFRQAEMILPAKNYWGKFF